MTIWQIDREIEDILNAVDPETGEALFDLEALEELQMARETKIENLALAVKNMVAEAAAIKAEEDALYKRRKAVEANADRAKRYLTEVCMEGYKSPRVVVAYRNSTALKLDDGFLEWAKKEAPGLLREKDPEPDKKQITDAIKQGVNVPFAEMVAKRTIQIK